MAHVSQHGAARDRAAATLLDVITTANPDGKHGPTRELTDAERAQLVSYLQQIDDAEGDAPASPVTPAPGRRRLGVRRTGVLLARRRG